MPLPKSRRRIIELFSQVKDDSLRQIISEVVGLENEFRSSIHFPIKKIEDFVDNEANLIEIKQKRGDSNEI